MQNIFYGLVWTSIVDYGCLSEDVLTSKIRFEVVIILLIRIITRKNARK